MNADLLYTDVEDELRASVRDLLADRAQWNDVLARAETDDRYDLELWRRLATEMGAAGLAVPEDQGGAGASAREVAVVMEELGRAVAPVPYLGSAVLSTYALMGLDRPLLGELAGGRVATLTVPFSTGPGDPFPDAVSVADGRLTGSVRSVLDADPADVLLVPARGADGPALYAVEASAAQRQRVVTLDLTRPLSDLTFEGAHGELLAEGDIAVQALQRALTAGAALLASEQLGIAERCLEMTIDYVKERYQFGRPVGSFQALKHRLAELWVEITQARAVARYAADCLARGDDDLAVAVAVAQAHCSEVAVHAAEECVQMHGGIGFTWEHPAHLYLKRAKSDAIGLGSAGAHRASLTALVDLPAAG